MKIYKVSQRDNGKPYAINVVKDKTVKIRAERKCILCSNAFPIGSIMRNVSLEIMHTSDCDYPSFENIYFCSQCSSVDRVQSYIFQRQVDTKKHTLDQTPSISQEEDDEGVRLQQEMWDKNQDFFRGSGPFKL